MTTPTRTLGADGDTTDRDAVTGPLAESGVRDEGTEGTAATMLAPSSASGSPRSNSVPSLGAMLASGDVLDGVYRVEKQIGRGAMGAVYLVEHLRLGRKFAAKVVAANHATNPDVVQRLRNEARIASQIQHENIVDVTHLGQTPDGSLFVVMELLEGRDLREWMSERRDTPIAFDDVRWIAADVMSGLAAAHDAGIVHRDLKPDNVFLVERQGRMRAKIVDFGISKSTHTDDDLRLTRTGQIMGTPLYMAPEQTRSTSDVDARADQYAFGVMLYELLAGRLPFEATSLYDIVVKHATEAPDPLHVSRPGVPVAVEAVVMRCLAKRPDARFESIDAVRAAWDAAWDEPAITVIEVLEAPAREPAVTRAPETPFVRRRGLALGLLVALLVAPPLAYLALRAETPPTIVAAPADRPPDPIPEPDPIPAPPVLQQETRPTLTRRTIHTTPEGATVRIGDSDVGTTPYELELGESASITIELRLRGYRRETRSVSAGDAPLTLELRRTAQAPDLAPR